MKYNFSHDFIIENNYVLFANKIPIYDFKYLRKMQNVKSEGQIYNI